MTNIKAEELMRVFKEKFPKHKDNIVGFTRYSPTSIKISMDNGKDYIFVCTNGHYQLLAI